MRQKGIALVLAALTLLCMALSLHAACGVAQCYPSIGLRYTVPLTAQQVAAARQRAQKAQTEQDHTALYPTFWRETQEKLYAAYASAQVTAIGCLGDYTTVWPAAFLAGGWPGQWQGNACAVSDTLAQALWGSTDIVGQTVRWGQAEYIVCGVFRSSRVVWVYSAPQSAGFTAVELVAPGSQNERQTALEYAQYSGLGMPDSILYGNTMRALAKAVALLPLWLAAAALLALLIKKRPGQKRGVVWLALGLAFALALPQLLSALPGWSIPSRWSDFAFWGRLRQAGAARVEEWLALAPKTKDVIGKKDLLAVAGWAAAAVQGEVLCLACGIFADILPKGACQK